MATKHFTKHNPRKNLSNRTKIFAQTARYAQRKHTNEKCTFKK